MTCQPVQLPSVRRFTRPGAVGAMSAQWEQLAEDPANPTRRCPDYRRTLRTIDVMAVAVATGLGLVAWAGNAWPDLAVAAGIAGLVLPSAWSTAHDSRTDRRDVT